MVRTVLTISGPKPTTCLTEQGLYFFLSRSDKPAALPFQKWIAGEVIPAIRKHGGYGIVRQQSGQTPGTINPELSAIILERLSAIEASLAPVRAKANRYDAFLSFDGTCGLTKRPSSSVCRPLRSASCFVVTTATGCSSVVTATQGPTYPQSRWWMLDTWWSRLSSTR